MLSGAKKKVDIYFPTEHLRVLLLAQILVLLVSGCWSYCSGMCINWEFLYFLTVGFTYLHRSCAQKKKGGGGCFQYE